MNDDLYREGDAAYQAAGGYEGLKKLTDDFYRLMYTDPKFKTIRDLHHETVADVSEKLALFLCGYFNGPHLYNEKYGPFRLAAFHKSLPIGHAERDAWLACMQRVLDQQPWADAFKEHVLLRLRTPAERCRTRP
jgi:hemoglobin